MAATAQQVSQLPLDRGEVALAVRVSPADADPASEVGRVGQAFNHMLNNVEEALAARQASETKVRQFVADASHELRNPLAAIRGYAELTRRRREELPTDAAYAMSRVESEADRMSHLVEDLLLLARLDSGPDLDIQPIDLTEVVVNAVNDARVAGPEPHLAAGRAASDPVIALADRHRLHQVVTNLLANARTHTPPGTLVEAGISGRGRGGDDHRDRQRARHPAGDRRPGLRAVHPGRREPGAHAGGRRRRQHRSRPGHRRRGGRGPPRPGRGGQRARPTRFTVTLPLADAVAGSCHPSPSLRPHKCRPGDHLCGRRIRSRSGVNR